MSIRFQQFEYEASFGTAAQLPASDLPEIAFSGRSNVGKSSLLNALCARKGLAKISSVPGKTTTVNFFRQGGVRFADLPGYGYAKRSDAERRRWAQLMEAYFSTGRDIRLVIQLIDIRHKPSADDMTMIRFLNDSALPYVIVLTKADKLNKTERAQRDAALVSELAEAAPIAQIAFSALKGEGIEALRKTIDSYVTSEQ